MCLGECLRHLRCRLARPDGGKGPSGGDEVAGPVGETDDRIGVGRDPDQLGIGDELQVSALDSRDLAALGLEKLQELVHRPAPVVG